MTVLALVTKLEDVVPVVAWGSQFATARQTTLTVLCWTKSSFEQFPLLVDTQHEREANELVDAVNDLISGTAGDDQVKDVLLPHRDVYVRRLASPNPVESILQQARIEDPELLVIAGHDSANQRGSDDAVQAILRQSPCRTIALHGGPTRSCNGHRIFVGISDSPHDSSSLFLAARMDESCNSRVMVARTEADFEDEALEVGRRELGQMMRDVGMRVSPRIKRQVFRAGNMQEISAAVERHDMFFVGAEHLGKVHDFLQLTSHPTIGVVKRAPPLRRWWRRKRHIRWNPLLSPADYTDLLQTLRRGSKLNIDFLVMLGLAAAIASLGLLQDSPAVVIGSMLLAPLMTPMLGSGLALAQANPKLGRSAMYAILIGFLLTLGTSFAIAWLTPGEDITSQVIARGDPNLLDLGIAVFSAAAGAYALARPNLAGTIAGVAIATALVPPLCSVGISLAYHDLINAMGATALFATNLVAIILGAAVTFRLMGITAKRAEARHRRWVLRTAGTLGIIGLILVIPLEQSLLRTIELGKPQPRMYPLTKSVADALAQFIARRPEIALVSAGRPGSVYSQADVVIVISSRRAVKQALADQLTQLIRHEMQNDQLKVNVHCVRENWADPANSNKEHPPPPPTDSD